tara:strand:- start:1349 stop:1573 length:225 start_codon:yes stop_codon:yes gene_type:complete
MSDGTVKPLLDLTRYITDDDMIEFYSYNYDTDDFVEWLSFMNAGGFGIEDLGEILMDYGDFMWCWDRWVDTFDF